jgi:hypothetical protein
MVFQKSEKIDFLIKENSMNLKKTKILFRLFDAYLNLNDYC